MTHPILSEGKPLSPHIGRGGDLRQRNIDARLVLGRTPNPLAGDPLYIPAGDGHRHKYNRLRWGKGHRRTPNKPIGQLVDVARAKLQARLLLRFAGQEAFVLESIKKRALSKKIDALLTQAISEHLQRAALDLFDNADDIGRVGWISIEGAFLKWIDADEEEGQASQVKVKNEYGPNKFDRASVRSIYSFLSKVESSRPEDIAQGIVLSDSEAQKAYHFLRKYRKQLPQIGIQFDRIIPPLTAAEKKMLAEQGEDEDSEKDSKTASIEDLMKLSVGEQTHTPTRSKQDSVYSIPRRIAEHKGNVQAQMQLLYDEAFSRIHSIISGISQRMQEKASLTNLEAKPIAPVLSFMYQCHELYYLGNRADIAALAELRAENEDAPIPKGYKGVPKGYKGVLGILLEQMNVGTPADPTKRIKYNEKQGYGLFSLDGVFEKYANGETRRTPEDLDGLNPSMRDLDLVSERYAAILSNFLRYALILFDIDHYDQLKPSKFRLALEAYNAQHPDQKLQPYQVQIDPTQISGFVKDMIEKALKHPKVIPCGVMQNGDLLLSLTKDDKGKLQYIHVYEVDASLSDVAKTEKFMREVYAHKMRRFAEGDKYAMDYFSNHLVQGIDIGSVRAFYSHSGLRVLSPQGDLITDKGEAESSSLIGMGLRKVLEWTAQKDPIRFFTNDEQAVIDTDPAFRLIRDRFTPSNLIKKLHNHGFAKLFLFLHSLGVPLIGDEYTKERDTIRKVAAKTKAEKDGNERRNKSSE